MSKQEKSNLNPVLILGAGINGAATARELALNGVPVIVVDCADLASGATSRSSRLIHGGLRYLEYGEIRLVRESLGERIRLLESAPHLIFPLRLFIPLRRRWGGLLLSLLNFSGLAHWNRLRKFVDSWFKKKDRGMWLVRLGLWFYDRFARDNLFDTHSVHRVGSSDVPQVAAETYRWLCAYSDARITYPERFVLEYLIDARDAAQNVGSHFEVLTYRRTELNGREVRISHTSDDGKTRCFRPSMVVNATGAWGDLTLSDLKIDEKKLFGGTKGSHIIVNSVVLEKAIGNAGVYSETPDGRMVFVLPFGKAVLIGTTDIRFEDRPEKAVASQEEIEYLLEMTNTLFPNVKLERNDIAMHYSGVRPLPNSAESQTSAISRGQKIQLTSQDGLKIFTMVGGKLTTGRLFGEQVADRVLAELGIPRTGNTKNRPLPGGTSYPTDEQHLKSRKEKMQAQYSLVEEQVAELWELFGICSEHICAASHLIADGDLLNGTNLPLAVVNHVVQKEWVTNLSDIVERRLMLLYRPSLSRKCLEQLAECLVTAGKLNSLCVEKQIAETVNRLETIYGKKIVS